MRINVDSKALFDPRFARLGAQLKISRDEALGRCLRVWCAAFENRSARMSADDIDAHADRSGFAKAMVSAELAQSNGKKKLRLRGVDDRVKWLMDQDEKREKANAARKRNRECSLQSTSTDPASSIPIASANGIPRDHPAGTIFLGASRPQAASHGMVPVNSDLDPALVPDPDQEQKSRVAIAELFAPPLPGGLMPPAGGKADTLARRRIVAGEITADDVQRCWVTFVADTAGQHWNGDKHLDNTFAKWIARERPSLAAGRHEPSDEDDYAPPSGWRHHS